MIKELLLSCMLFVAPFGNALPATSASNVSDYSVNENSPKGGIVALTIDFDVTNNVEGYATAYVKNSFTFLPTTVEVSLYLFCSNIETTDTTKMQWEAYVHSPDLNMGETLTISSDTGNTAKYWYAYANYNVNNGSTQKIQTQCVYLQANGRVA